MNTRAGSALAVAIVASALTFDLAGTETVLNIGLVPGEDPRFMPTDDAAYDVLRETAKLLNLDLKKMK